MKGTVVIVRSLGDPQFYQVRKRKHCETIQGTQELLEESCNSKRGNEGPARPKAKRSRRLPSRCWDTSSPKVRVTMVLFVRLGMNHHLLYTLLSNSGQTVINCDEWFHCFCV